MPCTQESGTCSSCRAACSHKPGWFLPGEAEKVAEYLGVTLAELFKTRLAVDWWEADHNFDTDVFLLAPAIEDEEPGAEYPGNPRGRCVFLTDDERCSIHAVKPHECRQHWCGEVRSQVDDRHKDVAEAWQGHQDQIKELLGREPEAEPYEGGGLFGLLDMLGGW
jgi:Fe-S-cluster containining protein